MNKRVKIYSMKYFVLIAIIIFPFVSSAQSILPPGYEEEVILKMNPEIPAPKENVSIRVENYSTDLNKSLIIWRLNGINQKQEVGLINYSFVAPEAGRQTTVEVEIQKPNGAGTLKKSLKIAPAGLDLVYEAQTYTPPLYKGRALFSHQSNVIVAAIPDFVENGIKLSKENIVYTWEKNDQVIQSISGLGKDSVNFQGDLISRPFTVSVTAQSPNSNIKAKRRITINPINPNVVIYENNPLYGNIFEKALNTAFNFDREELGITAIPYFFSSNKKDTSSLKYNWFENGKQISNDSFGSFINYTNIGREKSGVSNLSVSVSNTDKILQSNNFGFRVNVIGNEQSDTITNSDANNIF